ncbi:MAG: hypothetical protein Q9168_003924 [Polycauliona sp. 1 TL-2023]
MHMGTRGLKVWRYRKRYFPFFDGHDSYPSNFGRSIIKSIPTNPQIYKRWLEEKRNEVEEWEHRYEQYLSVPADIEKRTRQYYGGTREGEERIEDDDEEIDVNGEPPWRCPHFVDEHQLPSFTAPYRAFYLDWIYTIDLELETLSVNHAIHYHLTKLPAEDEWNRIASWEDEEIDYKDRGQFPTSISEEDLPSRANTANESNAALSQVMPVTRFFVSISLTDTTQSVLPPCKLVRPKSLCDIPWSLRHVPIFQNLIFSDFVSTHGIGEIVSQPINSFPFRELAYYVLCIAAGGAYMAITEHNGVEQETVYALLHDVPCKNDKVLRSPRRKYQSPTRRFPEGSWSEFVSQLFSGSHLQGNMAGASPTETIYWFNNALIVLTRQLKDFSDIEQGLHRIIDYHNQHHQTTFSAVLTSIKHIVLVKIFPDGSIEHTEAMPLFSGADGHATFQSLAIFFDSLARHQLRQYRHDPLQTNLPPEISTLIYEHQQQVLYDDHATHNACMNATPSLRDLCLQNYPIAKNTLLVPSEACQACTGPGITPEYLVAKYLSTGVATRIAIVEHARFQANRVHNWYPTEQFRILLGNELHRRVLLPFKLMMKSLEENQREDEWELKTCEKGLGWEIKMNGRKCHQWQMDKARGRETAKRDRERGMDG